MKEQIYKEKVAEFFNEKASNWDDEIIHDNNKINRILDNAKITKGSVVLDVATGTGILISDYIDREVSFVSAVDISTEMIKKAREKYEKTEYFSDGKLEFIVTDIYSFAAQRQYDAIVVYNAFPHFPDPEKLIMHLAKLLKKDGILTIAHGMGKKAIDMHHQGSAKDVSVGLMDAQSLADLISKYLTVTTVISEDGLYQVCGKKA